MARKSPAKKKTVEEVQYNIFRMMPPAKKLKLASDFSMFIKQSKNNAERNHGVSRINR